jgi:hypothetical protein
MAPYRPYPFRQAQSSTPNATMGGSAGRNLAHRLTRRSSVSSLTECPAVRSAALHDDLPGHDPAAGESLPAAWSLWRACRLPGSGADRRSVADSADCGTASEPLERSISPGVLARAGPLTAASNCCGGQWTALRSPGTWLSGWPRH